MHLNDIPEFLRKNSFQVEISRVFMNIHVECSIVFLRFLFIFSRR